MRKCCVCREFDPLLTETNRCLNAIYGLLDRALAALAEREATLDRLLAGELDTKTLEKLSLSRVEQQLVAALFKGQTVEAYANQIGISINTARWYVKNIYAKTGVRRQTELFHLLLTCHARHTPRNLEIFSHYEGLRKRLAL